MKRIASIYKNQRVQLVRSSLAMLSFLILFVAPALATHIVGGSISYRCLGNDQYEITVRVYRDCFNAAPGADFDDPASIGIFDRAGLLVADVRVPFVSEDTLTNIPSECLVIPGNVCVNTTTYVTTVELPFREGGYQLVYQRCCRNETIQNLVNPLETGATYDIWLTEESMLTCNNSPVFKEWPPIFICVNDELNFDHSAIDADGDSLVYKLIAPLQGGTFAEPMPQPPNPPPYDEVVFIDPTYSVDDFLGFGEPLKVDADNGLMTVTPGILGQFVVGVSVEEYDRETGTLLSVSRRDFQYNVIQCQPFEAVFEAPDAVCDEFTVQFDNQTEGASEFLWNFSSADTSFTSSERSPEITFPETGLYQVELIVDPGYVCETRFTKDIFVQTNSLTADFRIDVLACTDSSYLFLTDRSIDSVSAPVAWEWIISPEGMDPFTVNGQFPIVPVPMNSKGIIQLNVTSENNCMSSSTMTYEAPGIDLRTYLQDTIFACIGDQIGLNPLTPADVQLDYSWSGPGLSDPSLINPMIEVQDGTTAYQLIISGPENSCFIEADIVVVGGERPGLDFAVGTNCDGLSYRFEDLSTNANSIEWIIGDLSAPLLTTQEASFDFTFPTEGSYPVYLIGVAGCTDTLLRNIEIQNNDLDVGIDARYTACEADLVDVQLMAQTATTDSIISYDWRLSDGKTSTEPNPVFSFGESQTLTASLMVETAKGCVDSVEQELEINLITDVLARLPDTVALCDGAPTTLFPENDDRYTYEWSPAEGLDDPTSSNPTFLQPGIYNVVISIPGSASCRVETQVVSFLPEAINLDITVSELPDDFDASDNDDGNGSALDGIDLENLEEVPIVDGKVASCSAALLLTGVTEPEVSVDWYLNGIEVSADSLYYLAQATGENTYTAIATDRFGCTDTSTVIIDLQGVDIDLPDQIAVCDGEPIQVAAENTDPNDNLTYVWSPADWVVAGQGTSNADFDAPIGINYVTVEATNQFGCTTIDSVEIVVVDPNNDLKFEVTSLCDSVTVRFTNQSENAFGYLWNFGDPENPDATSTEESPIYTYSEPGTYTALLTLQYDVSCRDTFELTFNTALLPPDLDLKLNLPDTLFTGGNPTTVETIVDAETYTWTDSSGQVVGTEPDITVDPECEGIFYLEVTDEFGCVYRDTVVVVNEIIDVVLTPPSPVIICDGDQVQLMVENKKDCHTLSYLWGPDSLIFSGGNTANPVYTFDKEGTYQGTGIITNQYGISDTLEVEFVVGEIESGLMDTIILCDQDSVRLGMNSNPSYTYTWSPGDNLDDPNSNNPLFTGSERSTYFVTVTDGVCEILDTVTVIVPDVRLEPDLPDTLYTDGDPITIETMVDAETYSWTDSSGQVIGTGPSITVDPDCEAIYYLQMMDEFGCEYNDTVVVINPVIELAVLPESPITLCVGDEVQLMVENLKDCDTLSYSWAPDSLLVSDGDTANPTFQFNEAGKYQVIGIVMNQYGTVDTIIVDFNVGNLDGLGLMSPLTGCVGDAFDLFPGADSTLDYTWAPADLLDDPNAPNPRTIPLDRDTSFLVTVSLPGTACMIEDTVVVDVNDDVILDITADPGLMVCPQTTVTVAAELDEGATVAWLDVDGNLLGATDTLEVDVMDEPIEITAVARDTNGCEQRQTITLTPEGLDVGLDSPVEACAEIPTPINPRGSADYNYEWSPANGLDDAFSPNPIFDASMDQTFGVTVTDPVTGCIIMDSVEVNIIDHPSITLTTNDTMICEPALITLMAETDQPTTLEWFADAEMTMSLGTGNSIEVMPGEGLNEYFVKTGDEICVDNRDVDTVRVEVIDFSAVAPDTLLEICKNEQTRLNPNGDDRFSYEWSPVDGLDDPLSPNPSFDGVMEQDFTVTITSPDGMCMVERMQMVRLLDPVNLDAGTDTILCREGSFTLEANHEGGQNVMWAADRDFTESVSNGDSYEIELEDGGRYYYVKAENSLGCTELDSIFVGSGLIDAMLPEEVLVCDAAEGAMLLVSNNKPEQELTYLWMPEDKFESDPMAGPMATLEPGADGLIMVTLENQFGCSAELNTRVVVDDVGSARIEASDTVVQVGNPVELSVVDCEDCQYEWSPSETVDNPNSGMVTATPLETTEYFVTVTKGDCETVLSITIMTEGVLCTTENIFVPRAFTPNGDSQNDVLFVRSNVIDEMHFVIYNRWGQEVFDTRDINEGWDGTFRGNALPPDVYGYYLQARCIDGSVLSLQGNVTLLR